MNSWRPYPLLRLTFPFLAGIIAERLYGAEPDQLIWLPVLSFVLLLIMQIIPLVVSSYGQRWITGLAVNAFLLIAGYGIASCHRSSNDPDYLGKSPDGLFLASLAEPPSSTGYGFRAVLAVKYRLNKGGWVRTCGSVIGYLKAKPGVPLLQYGDFILLHAGFIEINDNSNPHAFNYALYLKNKGISHRVFAEPYCWKQLNLPPSGLIRKVAFQVRDRLLNILRDNHVTGKEFAVAAALLLGYVDELDADLRRDYAATGAMHILSVSGMHVGIIYIFLEFLLGFLNKSKPGRMAKAILLLVFIWFYAMITGLSPCVLRSAAMLSLPILGKALNRSPNMINIIAASILFILAIDPVLILDVGFQLSYLAVVGIIILYKPLYDLYATSAWLPDKIWSILAVSLAAQIGTLPITLYTFHQFPNYFMLTNIFVVPLSSLIIYIGILALAMGSLPIVSVLSAKLLILLIWSLNSVIHFIEQLPFSTIRGIFISAPEMITLYLLIAAIFLFLTLRRISFLYAILVIAIVLNVMLMDFQINRLRSSNMVVFNASREALYMFSTQDKAVIFYNETAKNERFSQTKNHAMAFTEMQARGIHYHREFMFRARGLQVGIPESFIPLFAGGNFIQFAGCRIALLGGPIPKHLIQRFDVDVLILTGNPKISIDNVVKIFHPGQIIIDATNSRFKTLQWLKDAGKSGVHCHAVTEHGAFQKEF